MKQFYRALALFLVPLVLGFSVVQAAPTQFTSPNYGVESVIFGGTGVLHSNAASIPPVILTGPTVSNITSTSATVSWTTDKDTNALVFVGTSSGNYTVQTGDFITTLNTNHSVLLNFLTKGVTYFYKVRSTDISGNNVESTEKTFSSDPGDITPPVITDGPTIAQNSASSVTITWETNEIASSVVEYGVKDVSENTAGVADEFTTFHQVTITVQTSQSYLLQVKTKDPSENVTLSPILTLDTLSSPSITDVHITDVTLNSALIQWHTSVASTSVVNFGTSSSYGQQSVDQTFTQNHIVQLSNLINGTVYYLRLSGQDPGGNRLNSDEYNFKTVILPTISDFTVSQITPTSVHLTWTSSSDIDEFVRYQVIASSVDPTQIGKQSATGNDKLVSIHALDLTDLDSSTQYTVGVSGKDVFGNQAISPTVTFTTPKDNIPPQILNVRSDTTVDLGSTQSVQVLVSFGLSKVGTTVLEYGAGATGPYTKKVLTDTDLSENKFLVIPGLIPGNSYHFRIVATDRAGNVTNSQDYLVEAPEQSTSLWNLIAGQITSNFGWLGNL